MASVMLAAGRSQRAAQSGALLLGAATMAGVLAMLLFRPGVGYALSLSAGVTVYIAASDLIPEVNREPGVRLAFVVFGGVALFLALKFAFRSTRDEHACRNFRIPIGCQNSRGC